MEKEFRELWEKERQEYIKKLGSKEYACNIDYTCGKIDSIRDKVKDHIKDELVCNSILNQIEELRQSVISLRDWGHDLRYLLLKEKNEQKERS